VDADAVTADGPVRDDAVEQWIAARDAYLARCPVMAAMIDVIALCDRPM